MVNRKESVVENVMGASRVSPESFVVAERRLVSVTRKPCKEADEVLNYVASRRQMIAYDQCERRGWRISSSTTESECGAAPHRVKGQGKRWDPDNAEAMIAPEALHQSNLWDEYWATCAGQNN